MQTTYSLPTICTQFIIYNTDTQMLFCSTACIVFHFHFLYSNTQQNVCSQKIPLRLFYNPQLNK